ncbi:MAG: response regulator [bacterium]|nr:response regulator [bacterium]
MRTVVVDDEEPGRRILREYLAEHPEIEIIAECANGFEAVKAVSELSPDLLFLDIRMPKLDGFDVIELLGDECPAVVFVTAYDQYALKAFEVHAVDYLLKPFTAERLSEALRRIRPELRTPRPVPATDLARAARPESHRLERILVRDRSHIHIIAVDRLDYVEAQDDYLVLASGGEKFRKQQTLSQLEAALDPGRFVRIHRSYLLNVDCLARLELYAKDSRVAILRDGARLPVSRSGYRRLRALL